MAIPLKWNIPGIRRILMIPASDIPVDAVNCSILGMPSLVSGSAREIPFVDVPLCEITETHGKSGVDWSSKLSFISTGFRMPPEPVGWIVVDNDGRAALLGDRTVIPSVKATASTGRFSDRKATTVEVTCITRPAACIVGCKIA